MPASACSGWLWAELAARTNECCENPCNSVREHLATGNAASSAERKEDRKERKKNKNQENVTSCMKMLKNQR